METVYEKMMREIEEGTFVPKKGYVGNALKEVLPLVLDENPTPIIHP